MKYEFIKKYSEDYPTHELCEALDINRSSYYKWNRGPRSSRREEDENHKLAIQKVYHLATGHYGHRPLHKHLIEEGIDCGRDRTLRLMKEMGLQSKPKKCFKPMGTDSTHEFGYSSNLLKNYGSPSAIDQVWVADTTYLETKHGWIYLATVMDLYSRRIVGWALSSRNNQKLVCDALKAAILNRGCIDAGIIAHSDRGSTYASDAYLSLLKSFSMHPSMSAKGNCYDNAAMESFYGRYKTSTLRGQVFANQSQARANVFAYIEGFYNRFRKHSSLGYKSPLQFEEPNFKPFKVTQACACSFKN